MKTSSFNRKQRKFKEKFCTTPGSAKSRVDALKLRVKELSNENAELRQRVKELEACLIP